MEDFIKTTLYKADKSCICLIQKDALALENVHEVTSAVTSRLHK